MADPIEVAVSGVVTPVEQVIVPVVTDVKTVVAEVTKPNAIVTFFKELWAKIEDVDTAINTWISKVTSGYTTLAVVAVAVAYWLLPVKAILSFLLAIPAQLIKLILDAVGVLVPVLFSAVPYAIGIILILLAIVEIKNLGKTIFK
jgi:hypothetical protein